MTISKRLLEERKRLKMSQTELAQRAGTTKKSQVEYEKERLPAFAFYLEAVAAAGVDVRYVLTGQPSGEPSLTDEDRALLALFRQASPALRQAAIAVLSTGQTGGTIVGGDYIRASENARVYKRVGGNKRAKQSKNGNVTEK